MAKARHIHQYERKDIGKKGRPYIIYKCALTNCPHYVPEDLVVGRLSTCPYCSEPFTIKQSDLALVKPHCKDCINEVARANAAERRVFKENPKAIVSESLGSSLLESIQRAKG